MPFKERKRADLRILPALPQSFFRITALCLFPLLMSGCVRGLFEGDRSFLRPDFIRYTATTDPSKPVIPEVRPQPGLGESAVVQVSSASITPMAVPELLPDKLPLQSPQVLKPFPLPEPPKPSEQPQRAAGPPRRLAVASPDFAYRDQVITQDVIWRGEVLVTGAVTVAPQATLTIEPGTVVRFAREAAFTAGGVLMVQGRLAASGTKNRPVLFTSRFAEPVRGDWQGIVLLGSEKKNILQNCRIEGAETGLDASYSVIELTGALFANCTTGVRLQDTIVTGTGCGADGCQVGMTLVDSEADLHDVAFSGNGKGLLMVRSALYLVGGRFIRNGSGLEFDDSRLKLSGATVASNGSGLTLTSSQGTVSNCSIADNSEYGASLVRSRVRMNGNLLSRNGTGLKVENSSGAAWGNAFSANGRCDMLNAGSEEFRAMGNWWEAATADIAMRICDRQVDPERGRIIFFPPLTMKPAAGASLLRPTVRLSDLK